MKKLILYCFLVLGGSSLWAQSREITGQVKDDTGEALIGVNITLDGTSRGTISDFQGRFSLEIPGNDAVLRFTFLGYAEQAISVGALSNLEVIMLEDISRLDEVIVVGYGTQIKSTLTGNIARVSGDDIQSIPVPSLEEALQGRAAGIFIESTNGKPGGANRVRIRGSASISATNQPLYVVDGVPISLESLNGTGAPINPLTDINPNDIESVEILKDASAAAIYGSRAANGVILITTKKGKTGTNKLNFNLQTGWSNPTNRREFMNSEEYIEYFRHAARNSDILEDDDFWSGFVEGRLRRYSGHGAIIDSATGAFLGSTADTDWQDQAFRTGRAIMADLSASGGTDKLRYFASGSLNSQEGILVANGFQRLSARLNLDNKVNNWMDMGLQFNMARTQIDQVAADNAFSTPIQLVALAPITPVRDLEGNLYDRPTTTYYNGLLDVEDAVRDIQNYRTLVNGYLNFKLMPGLNWRNELGYDGFTMKENAFYGSRTQVGEAVGGLGTATYGQSQNIVAKSFLNYDKSIKSWNLNAILGTELQYTEIDRAFVEGREFPLDDLKTLASAAEISGGTSTFTQYSFISYFSRFNLDYKRKYLLSVSGRVDGSSRFGVDSRYGFFPSVSAGWVLTEEDIFADISALSFLKLRASYGSTGNAGIGNFEHLGLFGAASYNQQPGLRPTQTPNPLLGWETTNQVDLGIDFGFFDNRLTGEIDYYDKVTTDLLLAVPIPGTSGFAIQTQNIGGMRNRGVEFVLHTNNTVGAFKWNTSLNFAFNRNTVTDLGDQEIIDGGSSRFMNVVIKGQPLGVFYGAEYAGVDPNNGDALWFINEKDENGEIINAGATTNDFNEANFVPLGNPTPEYIGGMTNSFSFKGFELSFMFQGVFGNMIHLAGDSFMAGNGEWFDNQTRDQLNSWRAPGDITDIPQARLAYVNGSQARNSRYLSPGSYVRLRSLTFGYTFPRHMTNRMGLDRLRIYLMGQNLLTFTNYIGWDPEVSTDFAASNVISGVDFYSAPQPRTVTFGINVGF